MAIDKQIPVKPFYHHEKNYVQGYEVEDVYVKCPICLHRFFTILDGEKVAGKKTNYCSFCGQKMDWSGDDDQRPYKDKS